MLSEIDQAQKDKHSIISPVSKIQNVALIEVQSRKSITKDSGEWERRSGEEGRRVQRS